MPRSKIDRVQSLLLQLLAIRGRSRQEGRVVRFLIRKLLQAGLPESALFTDRAHEKSPYGGETGNLIVRLPGTVRKPRRLLSAHMDTVPICVGVKPVVRDGWIVPADPSTGLGADDRAGVAVLLYALTELLRTGLPHPPLTFLFTVQEELGLIGARHVDKSLLGRPKAGFNFDGSEPGNLTIGATSGYRMEIDIHGIASHAGCHPENGVSAVTVAAKAIADLEESGWHGLIEKENCVGTSNVGVIEGGDATNVVAPRCQLKAEARSRSKTRARKDYQEHQTGIRASREIDEERRGQNRPGRN